MKDQQLRFIFSLSLISFLGIFGLAQLTAAQSLLPSCTATGNCTICDIVQTGINIGGAIIAIVGSLILLMFVYGGLLWLISAGRPDYVKKGKDVLINSLVGLGIIMTAYLAVTAVISVVTSGSSGQEWNWQGKLTCVPIDFSPKPPDNAANLTATINVPPDDYGGGAGGSGLPAGSPCVKNEDCKGFCANKTQELPKDYKNEGAGTNKFEEKKCADKLPANAGCENVAMENDDLGCASGKCADEVGTDYCYGEALRKAGEACTKDAECEGFCAAITGQFRVDVKDDNNATTFTLTINKCANKLAAYSNCTDVAMNDDDKACASGICDEGFDPDYCKGDKLPPGASCTKSDQCAGGFCASKDSAVIDKDIFDGQDVFITPPLVKNKCHIYLPNKAECEEVAIGWNDYACAGGECDIRVGQLDYCKDE